MGVLVGKKIVGESRAKVVYCPSTLAALRMVKSRGGTGVLLRTAGSTRWVRISIGETDFYPGAVTSDVEQYIAFRDYCHEIGIGARSIQAMSFYMLRAGLAGYFDVDDGEGIPFSMFPSGARMHAIPGIYRDVYQSDITAAYLWGIGTFTPARSFRHLTGYTPPEFVANNPGSWALCVYSYPHRVKFGALPYIGKQGTTLFPTERKKRTREVLLSSFDIRAGLAVGAEIRVSQAWIAEPISVTNPFSAFMHQLWNLREESAFPSVAKQAGNTLWGNFVANGQICHATFLPGKRPRITAMPYRPQLCPPVGYGVLGKLRSRLYIEGVNSGTVHAHTDGAISAHNPVADIRGCGNWRLASRFAEVEILTASWYRTVTTEGEIRYKLAGRPDTGERAARAFARFREREIG